MRQTIHRTGPGPDRPHDGHFASENLLDDASGHSVPAPRAPDQAAIVAGLRGDGGATFSRLFRDHNDNMVAVARTFVRDADVAEEVVQETWMAVLDGIADFEGRSSLRTWVLSILANKARRRATREGRTVPFSAMGPDGADNDNLDADRLDADATWMEPLHATGVQDPERILGGREAVTQLAVAVDELPEAQRAVVLMRDVEGCSAEETSEILGVTPGHQRVLLHRAHARLRAALTSTPGREIA